MTSNEVVDTLRRADPARESVIDRLAKDIEQQARGPVRAAVGMINEPDPRSSGNATKLLSNLGDLAMDPLLDAPPPRDVSVKLWSMQALVAAHLDLREKLVARLNAMLDDKTRISWGRIGPTEQVRPDTRVCDEAYIQMRRILNTGEGKSDWVQERKSFFAMSDQAKDAEILRARRSRSWTTLLGREEEEEEE